MLTLANGLPPNNPFSDTLRAVTKVVEQDHAQVEHNTHKLCMNELRHQSHWATLDLMAQMLMQKPARGSIVSMNRK